MPPVRRIGFGDSNSMRYSAIERARMQDMERAINDDERYFEATGENRLSAPIHEDVIVDAEEDPVEREFRMRAQEAYNKREVIREERVYNKAADEFEKNYVNSILLLEI